MSDKLFTVWVIYAKPKDFPNHYVARAQHMNLESKDILFDETALVAETPDPLRIKLHLMGRNKIERMEGDDPCILETWI